MAHNPLNLLSRSAAALMKAGLETLAGAERQGASLVNAIVGNGRPEQRSDGPLHDNREASESAWSLLETFFDHRIARALNALQIPTSDDIHELSKRVEVLTEKVASLEAARTRRPAATGKRPSKKAPARKKRTQAAGH